MSWDNERSFTDYGQDKRYGETYHESFTRQSNSNAARHQAMEKSMSEARKSQSGNTISADDFYDGKTERTLLAKIAGNIGIGLLAIAAICYFADVTYTPFEDSTIAGFALKAGIGFVVLGYFAHVIAVFVFIIACIYLITMGFSGGDGFSISAIPGSSWGISIFVVVLAAVLSHVFGRK